MTPRHAPRPVPPYEAFAARAKELTREIPKEFTEDVEDVVVHRGIKKHPVLDDIVTLGECEPSPLSAMTASGLVRSIVHLYYGSFVDLARRDDDFDVDAELLETIRHELQHHLEDKAGVKTLIDEDDLFEAHARFRANLDVPPGWYRQGEPLEADVWSVDLDLFVELRMRRKEFDALRGRRLEMTVLGEPLEVDVPDDAEPDEVFTLEGEGLLEDEAGGGHDRGHGPSHGHGGGKGGGRSPGEKGRGEEGATRGPGARVDDVDVEDEDGDGPPAGDLHIVPVVR